MDEYNVNKQVLVEENVIKHGTIFPPELNPHYKLFPNSYLYNEVYRYWRCENEKGCTASDENHCHERQFDVRSPSM